MDEQPNATAYDAAITFLVVPPERIKGWTLVYADKHPMGGLLFEYMNDADDKLSYEFLNDGEHEVTLYSDGGCVEVEPYVQPKVAWT